MSLIPQFHKPDRSWFILILTLICWLAVSITWIIAFAVSPSKARAFAAVSTTATAPATATAAAPAPVLPDLPQPITSFGAAVLDDHLYIVGGHSGDPHQYSKETLAEGFHRIDLRKPAKWESLPATRKLQGVAAVGHGGRIYRIGGLEPRNVEDKPGDLHSVADVARFDVKSRKWEDCTPLPEPRSSHDAVVVGNEVIVIGGWTMAGDGVKGVWLTTVWSADLTQWPLKWKTLAETPFKRRAMSIAAADRKVIVIGGLEPKGGTTDAVSILDLDTGKWSQGAPFPSADRMKGFGSSAFGIGKHIYANGWSTPLLSYDVQDNAWKPLDIKLNHQRFFHRLVAHGNDRLIVIGGAGKGGQREDAQVIRIP